MASSGVVVSRHTFGRTLRWNVRGENLNAWCKLPGSMLRAGGILVPNRPPTGPVQVWYEPTETAEVDRFTFFVRCDGARQHPNILSATVSLLDHRESVRDSAVAHLGYGDEAVLTVRLDPRAGLRATLGIGVGFEELNNPATYGHITVRYALGYRHNALDDLLNEVGSDKGTAIASGGGAPHCYSMAYSPLFEPWRDDKFRMLEIGLQDCEDAEPSDAPSLRAWHEFFPQAAIFGFDIADFSFYEAERTRIFRGDQSSREDWAAFGGWAGADPFRLILDDGSHASSDQQISLAALFPRLEAGGLYVIEDLHWQPYEESPTTHEVLRELEKSGQFTSPHVDASEAAYIERTVESVSISKPNDSEVAFLRKRPDTGA